MTPSKPREWWLCIEMECEDGESEGYAYTGKSPMNSDDVRVIEHAAFDQLLAEAENLRDALASYKSYCAIVKVPCSDDPEFLTLQERWVARAALARFDAWKEGMK